MKIPPGVTAVGSSAFESCTTMFSAIISEGTTTLESRAFFMCHELILIMLPSTITAIGDSAFLGCESLTDIYFEGTLEAWNAVEKGEDWDRETPYYTVHCADGSIETDPRCC